MNAREFLVVQDNAVAIHAALAGEFASETATLKAAIADYDKRFNIATKLDELAAAEAAFDNTQKAIEADFSAKVEAVNAHALDLLAHEASLDAEHAALQKDQEAFAARVEDQRQATLAWSNTRTALQKQLADAQAETDARSEGLTKFELSLNVREKALTDRLAKLSAI